LTPEAQQIFGATYDPPDHLWLSVFFTPSEASQAAGHAFLNRIRRRTKDRDPEVSAKVAPAQIEALGSGVRHEEPVRLFEIAACHAGGQRGQRRDHLTINSYLLQQNIPTPQLISTQLSRGAPTSQCFDLCRKPLRADLGIAVLRAPADAIQKPRDLPPGSLPMA